jgi:DNA-binding CsgD family transcriptional regulator
MGAYAICPARRSQSVAQKPQSVGESKRRHRKYALRALTFFVLAFKVNTHFGVFIPCLLMERLAQRDISALLEFIQSNGILRDLPEFRSHVLSALPRLVHSEVTGYNEVDTRRWRDEYMVSPLEAFNFPDSFQIFDAHIREHPVIIHLAKTQGTPVLKISDFLMHRQFSRTGLYQEFFRRLGTRDQIAVTLKVSRRTMVGIALNRRRDYTERERLLLTLVRPHLVQAYQNALAVTRLKEEAQNARHSLELFSSAAVSLRQDGSAFSIPSFALQLLRKYFDPWRWQGSLPGAVREWMKGQRVILGRLQAVPPLVVNKDGKRLVIRLLLQNDRTVLLLNEQAVPSRPPMCADLLAATGLSPREAEILAWVARGRTNDEIAQILRLSVRTVQKHIEHIFQKLGVENRTAAAARAWETLSQA